MQEIHDLGYKKLFANKDIFRQLLTSFVHEPWVQDLDFAKCELLKDTFVSRKYKKAFSDLLYKVKLRGRDVYIVVLLEFKSSPERFTPVQMAGYILDFYRHLLDAGKKPRALPPVFPILLYNGKRRWKQPLRLSALVEGAALLGKYKIDFECFPIRINSFSRKALLRIGNIVSTLFLAEAHYDFEMVARELMKLVQDKEQRQAAFLFLNWFQQLFIHERISEGEYQTFEGIYYDQEESPMLLESIRREKAQLRNAGKREGKREGMTLQQRRIAQIMLQNGEPLDKVMRYTDLSEGAILRLLQPKNGKGTKA